MNKTAFLVLAFLAVALTGGPTAFEDVAQERVWAFAEAGSNQTLFASAER